MPATATDANDVQLHGSLRLQGYRGERGVDGQLPLNKPERHTNHSVDGQPNRKNKHQDVEAQLNHRGIDDQPNHSETGAVVRMTVI